MTNTAFPKPTAALDGRASFPSQQWYDWFRTVNALIDSGAISNDELAQAIQDISFALGSPDGTPENIPPQGGLPKTTYVNPGAGIKVSGSLATGGVIVALDELADTGVGASLWKFTRDQYGRVEGTEAATTDDLPEGETNLYFTEERAQDAVGSVLADSADINLTYDDITPAISGVLTTTGIVAGTYGNATNVPQVTLDSKGRATSVVDVPISFPPGVADFIDLGDVPAAYTGAGGYSVKVKATEDGLEFLPGTGSGDVVGPASATDNAITRYDGITGKLIQDSGVVLQDDAAIEGASAIQFAKQPSNPATAPSQAIYQDNGTTYEDGTLVWANKSVFLDEMSVGDPGFEQGSIQVNGVLLDAVLKVNEFGGGREASAIFHRHAPGTSATAIFARSRGSTSAHSDVLDGDVLGRMDFVGWNTSSYYRAGRISVEVGGTPGAGDMPGRMVLSVTPDGGQNPQEWLRAEANKDAFFANRPTAAGSSVALFGDGLSNFTNDPGYLTSATGQPLDATLTALAGASWAANAIPIGTGADTLSQTSFAANTFPARASTGNIVAKPITDFGLSLVDDADATAAKTTLGIPALDYGVYTPTVTNVTNASGNIPRQCQWLRVGDTVTVSGRIDVTATLGAGTLTVAGVSLPIPSNFTLGNNLSGAGGAAYSVYATALISADTTNDRASIAFQATTSGSVAIVFTFSYTVI